MTVPVKRGAVYKYHCGLHGEHSTFDAQGNRRCCNRQGTPSGEMKGRYLSPALCFREFHHGHDWARRVVALACPHLTQRGKRREPIFFAGRHQDIYRDLLPSNAEGRVEVGADCRCPIMFHLILIPRDGWSVLAVGETHHLYQFLLTRVGAGPVTFFHSGLLRSPWTTCHLLQPFFLTQS